MPLDAPKPGESLEDYLNYCIPVEIQAGKEQDQAAAICISTYKKQEMTKLRTSQEKFTAKLKYSQQFRGINLTNFGENSDACWDGYIQVGTKILDGREVPDCRGPVDEMETQPTISSTYPGQGPTTASLAVEEGEVNVFGYHTKNFDMCPGAFELFTHLMTMPMDDDTIGMLRSAAQIADNVFHLEKVVMESKSVTPHELEEAILLVDDFRDLMEEIDEEVGMTHDTSFMNGHIEVIKSFM
jgi:hypothetical protein